MILYKYCNFLKKNNFKNIYLFENTKYSIIILALKIRKIK